MEQILEATLKALCPRVHVSVAPFGTQTPFIVWQQTGGQDVSYTDNTNAKRHARVQISVWASKPKDAADLRDRIEAALRPLETLDCTPSAAHYMTYEPETKLHGVQQVWEIWV